MKRIVLDYLRRRGWILGIVWLLHLVMTAGSWTSEKTLVVVAALCGGPITFSLDLMGGGAALPRTMLALPLTERQVARAWRFVALEFPVAIFLLALALGAGAMILIGRGEHITWERFGIAALAQTLPIGTHFFAMIGLPTHRLISRGPAATVSQIVSAALWGGTIPLVVLMAQQFPARFADLGGVAIAIGGIMLILTVAGWFRAEMLIQSRVTGLNRVGSATQPCSVARKTGAPVAGFGGLPYLGWFIARSVCLLSAAILVVNGGVVHLMTLHSGPRAVAAYFPQFIFLVMFTGLMAIGSLLTHARLLRSLPVSRLTLAGLIVFFPFGLSLVSALAGVGLLRVTGGIRPEPERILLWMLIQIPYVFVAPLALRFGFRMSVLASMIAFATASMGVSSYFIEKVNFESAPTLAVAIGLAVTMVPLAWMLTHLALGTSHPWKSGALRMPFQPRRV